MVLKLVSDFLCWWDVVKKKRSGNPSKCEREYVLLLLFLFLFFNINFVTVKKIVFFYFHFF